MESRKIFICLAALTILLVSVQGLNLKKSHEIVQKNSHQLQKLAHLFDDDVDPEMPHDIFSQFDAFVDADDQLREARDNHTELSFQGQNKIKNFLIDNQHFMDLVSQALDSDPTAPVCLHDFTAEQKRRYIIILINSKDLHNFFIDYDHKFHRDPQQIETVKHQFNHDDLLGQSQFQCVQFYMHSSKII